MSYMQLEWAPINCICILGIQDGEKRVLVDLHERNDLLCAETAACVILPHVVSNEASSEDY